MKEKAADIIYSGKIKVKNYAVIICFGKESSVSIKFCVNRVVEGI